jgi:hypothetical protein
MRLKSVCCEKLKHFFLYFSVTDPNEAEMVGHPHLLMEKKLGLL